MRESRLLAILIRLQLHRRLTAHALASEFEVSVRTIYRDIDRLSAAGVPVYGDKGPGGGFQLLDGYRTQLTGLDADEAEAMVLIGLPGLAAQLGLRQPSSRALDKLRAALPDRLRDEAGRLEGRIHLDPADWYRAADEAPLLPALARAVFDGRRIAFDYASWRAERRWMAHPLGLVLKGGAWYLVAEARGRPTIFRASQIDALDIGDVRVERTEPFDLAAYWRDAMTRFERELRPKTCTVQVTEEGARRLAEAGAYAADAVAAGTADEGVLRVTLPIESLDQAARLLLGLGDVFTILHPPELAHIVMAVARRIADRTADAVSTRA